MFKGLNLKDFSPNASFVPSYKPYGEAVTAADSQAVRSKLAEMAGSVATLDGSKIQETWFPQVNADVFISHSHRNVDAAMAMAGWLKQTFELTAFVDSGVWGYAADLLKVIDDRYCLDSETKTYRYEDRNDSTSHVHVMLSTALGMMIDRAECLFFLNSPESISSSDVVANKTMSPWIYAELMMAGIMQERPPRRHSIIKAAASRDLNESKKAVSIEYAIPKLTRLKEISVATLNAWLGEPRLMNDEHPLDVLYRVAARN